MKLFFLISCLIILFGDSSASAVINCFYDDSRYEAIGVLYDCEVKNNPNITSKESAQISSVAGSHHWFKNNNDVAGFAVKSQTVHYFPIGLHDTFKNLKLISIKKCGLKEIHQSDLKGFSKLTFLNLAFNDLEVIEKGLFDFNPNLKILGFYESKVTHIDFNAFDNLNKLTYLWVYAIPCINKDIYDSRVDVEEAIGIMKVKCVKSSN
ncbi:hypothetical protein ACKWTF_011173 [Chironomus riparius]